MTGILICHPPNAAAQPTQFIEGLEPKLREKLLRQLIFLPRTPRANLREPHFKHFSLERYRDLYELREKSKIMVRVIFTVLPDGNILLLHAFVKQRRRDTMQALDQALRVLAEYRECPQYAAEYKVKEEGP